MVRKKRRYCCMLCGDRVDFKESPMLKQDTWDNLEDACKKESHHQEAILMCVPCMEKLLGRKISEDDLLIIDGCHVAWNTEFIKKHFKNCKYKINDNVVAFQTTVTTGP